MCRLRHRHDDMSDKDEFDLTDTYVSYSELTGKLDLRETAAQARREAEAREDKGVPVSSNV